MNDVYFVLWLYLTTLLFPIAVLVGHAGPRLLHAWDGVLLAVVFVVGGVIMYQEMSTDALCRAVIDMHNDLCK